MDKGIIVEYAYVISMITRSEVAHTCNKLRTELR